MTTGGSVLDTKSRGIRSDGAITRARVIDAVVECIVENGYYEASSNAIARHAGVTWGTIQHQFGTRQALLLAVLEDRWQRLRNEIEQADVSGETLEERLECVMTSLEAHYGSPEHLVLMQIMLDLIQSPATSAATKRAVSRHGRNLLRVWRPMFARALGDAAADGVLVKYAFLVMRGYLSASTTAAQVMPSQQADRSMRTMLLRGVAGTVRARAAEQGFTIR